VKNLIIQIDTYIKDQDSIDLTEECIKRSRLFGYPILLTAHTEIPEFLKNQVDYTFVDLNNPTLEDNGSISSLNTYHANNEINIILRNSDPHAPACLTSLINGAKFALDRGYEYFLRIEYDVIIKYEKIETILSLLNAGVDTSGLIFTNSEEWVDGKIILCNSKQYLDSFNVQIDIAQHYLDFVSSKGIHHKDWRHLQVVQYQILRNNGIIQNMIKAPTGLLEEIIDKKYKKINPREIGIFRPGVVRNYETESFASIARGFAGNFTFNFEIYGNGHLISIEEQNFIEDDVTYKIFPVNPETSYEIVYTNPLNGEVEKWKFTSPDELEGIAKITFK